jgi:D-alanyl-D-alanine carboxypeptidase (penicillin-binding protein 5/6)
MKKVICVLLCCMLLTTPVLADAPESNGSQSIVTEYYSSGMLTNYDDGEDSLAVAATASDIQINAKAAILMEQNTGTVLYEQNADEQMPPASITKIMSLLLVCEAIDAGKISLDTAVTCSEHAASMGGSQIWLEPGETMTVDELLKAAAVGSANDATCALGEAIAGSEEGFVAMMNARAAELGMSNTHFVNCTGLDADGHLTTARDIAAMSRELIKHDLIKSYTTIWMDTLRGGQTQLVNTNKLVRFYDGATGLKTGTTDKAGHCLSATATKGNLNLISVVLGSDSGNNRFIAARKLLDYGFANWGYATVEIAPEELAPLKVVGGSAPQITLSTTGRGSYLVSKGSESKLEKHIDLPESIEAPVNAGDTVGRITITLGGETLGEMNIIAAEDVPEMTLWIAFGRLLNALLTL